MKDMTMENKIKFTPVTGECRCCGGNNFHFDEKEQTFVCEFCGTEVYNAGTVTEPVKEEKTEPKKVDIKQLPDVEQIFPPVDTSDDIKILGVFAAILTTSIALSILGYYLNW